MGLSAIPGLPPKREPPARDTADGPRSASTDGGRGAAAVSLIIAVSTAAALALRLYQLSRPGYLLGVTQYDDGPYFGSAVRLVQGVLPYRDFTMVQPPGITLLMAPAALLAKVAGTAWGMAAGRLLTVLASAASVTMTGLLVRHRGVLAAAVACGIMTVYPANLLAAHTVLVEPWLVLFCLAGALAVFDGDRLTASSRRLAWGGVASGFAGAVEAWGIFPVIVLAALALPAAPPMPRFRRAAVFGGGVAVGFLVPVLPFAAIAPRGMYQSLVTAQINRVIPAATPIWSRLRRMTGAGQVFAMGNTAVLILALAIVAFVVGAMLTAWLITRRPLAPLDWYALATTAMVLGAFLWYPQFFLHFPAFLAPFLSLALALSAARLAAAVGRGRPEPGPGRRWAAAGVAGLAIVLIAFAQAGRFSELLPRVQPGALATARQIIPPGACVATDQVSFLLAADRFNSDVPGCSLMVDGLATDYVLSHGRDGNTGAGRVPAVAAVWRSAFAHAGYAWLSVRFNNRRIGWNPALLAYFRAHFEPVMRDGKLDILYARRH